MNEPYEGRISEWGGVKCELPLFGHDYPCSECYDAGRCLGVLKTGGYAVKGEAETLSSGMNRESEDGKVDYTLVRDGPMYRRWAEHLTRAIPKRGRRNWMRAHTKEDLERFKRGASRHFEQWLEGLEDEDHAAALFFNVNGVERVRGLLDDQGGEA